MRFSTERCKSVRFEALENHPRKLQRAGKKREPDATPTIWRKLGRHDQAGRNVTPNKIYQVFKIEQRLSIYNAMMP